MALNGIATEGLIAAMVAEMTGARGAERQFRTAAESQWVTPR